MTLDLVAPPQNSRWLTLTSKGGYTGQVPMRFTPRQKMIDDMDAAEPEGGVIQCSQPVR
jgi:hypothetical protein